MRIILIMKKSLKKFNLKAKKLTLQLKKQHAGKLLFVKIAFFAKKMNILHLKDQCKKVAEKLK